MQKQREYSGEDPKREPENLVLGIRLPREDWTWLAARRVKSLVDMEVIQASGNSVEWLWISWRHEKPCENNAVF